MLGQGSILGSSSGRWTKSSSFAGTVRLVSCKLLTVEAAVVANTARPHVPNIERYW